MGTSIGCAAGVGEVRFCAGAEGHSGFEGSEAAVAVFADDVLVPDAGGAARADCDSAAGAAFFSGGLLLQGSFSGGFSFFGGCRGNHGGLHHAAGVVGRFKVEFLRAREHSARG